MSVETEEEEKEEKETDLSDDEGAPNSELFIGSLIDNHPSILRTSFKNVLLLLFICLVPVF